MRVLVVTSEWPTPERPADVPFLVRRVDALRASGVDVDVETFRGAGRVRNYIKARVRVRRRLEAGSYDVAHAHFGQSGLTLVPSPIPMVVTFRGSELHGVLGARGRYTIAGFVLTRVSRFVAKRADEVVVVSEALASKLPKDVRFRVVPSGVDLETFYPGSRDKARTRAGLPSDRKLILFSGRPDVPVKRYPLAERAVELAAGRNFDIELVSITGQPPQVVADYMRACDVLLLTSRHEGAPAMVKEALACSLPVVSTDVGDVRAVIGDLDGCVVCEDDDPTTIADALTKVLSRLGPFEGRDRVLELDERRLAQLDIEAYRAAIERRASRVP